MTFSIIPHIFDPTPKHRTEPCITHECTEQTNKPRSVYTSRESKEGKVDMTVSCFGLSLFWEARGDRKLNSSSSVTPTNDIEHNIEHERERVDKEGKNGKKKNLMACRVTHPRATQRNQPTRNALKKRDRALARATAGDGGVNGSARGGGRNVGRP